jgi:hypothetical protein
MRSNQNKNSNGQSTRNLPGVKRSTSQLSGNLNHMAQRVGASAGNRRSISNLRPNIGGPETNLENFTTAQKNINNSIFEYLMKFGYTRSIDELKNEISSQKGQGYI